MIFLDKWTAFHQDIANLEFCSLMPRIIHTVPVESIRTDALPRICISRNCLNLAEKQENYCTACIEQQGIKRGFHAFLGKRKKQTSSRKTIGKLTKRIASYVNDCITIYCVRMGANGPIKIGKTRDLNDRLSGLQTGSPYKLIPLVEVLLPSEMEGMIHAYLDEYRMEGEWFAPELEVMEIVTLLDSGNLDKILSKFESRLQENAA